MSTRKSLSKKLRFEILKRDSFACQYCGKKAPDVLLEIDHIEPAAKGGTDDLLNLITSCKDCNSGKSDRLLSDSAMIDKQRAQLEELQARKEQIEMMFQWQKGLMNLDDDVIIELKTLWEDLSDGYSLNDKGVKSLRSLKRRFGIDEIMSAMKIASEHYIVFEEGRATHESVELAWNRVGGICNTRRKERDKPYLQRLYYIRGILRKRLSYFNEGIALRLLEQAIEAQATLDSLEDHAKSATSWSRWQNEIEAFIASSEQVDEDPPPRNNDEDGTTRTWE